MTETKICDTDGNETTQPAEPTTTTVHKTTLPTYSTLLGSRLLHNPYSYRGLGLGYSGYRGYAGLRGSYTGALHYPYTSGYHGYPYRSLTRYGSVTHTVPTTTTTAKVEVKTEGKDCETI